MEVKLFNNRGKVWVKINNDYVKGFAFIGDRLLKEKELYGQLIEGIKQSRLSNLLLKLNGNFSAIIRNDGTTYLSAC